MYESQASGMPAAMTEQQIRVNTRAAMGEVAAFRHSGPVVGVHGQEAFTPQQTLTDVPSTEQQYGHSPGRAVYSDMANNSVPMPNQPVLFFKRCDRCDWSSIASYDARAYDGAVKDYDSHMREAHSENADQGDPSSRSKDQEEFNLATKPRKVEACEDDGLVNLSKARFFRTPFSWKNCQLSVPLQQKPVCTVVDFEAFGIEVNNKTLLRDLHDRGHKSLKLKLFTDQNLTIVPTMQDTVLGFTQGASGRLYTSKAWKEISGTKEAIKAGMNYMLLCRHMHPLDSGPQVLFKVMLEKYLCGNANQTNLASFFGSVTWENASRATRSEVPHKYQELVNKWDTTFGGGAGPSYLENNDLFDRKVVESLKRVAPLSPHGKKSKVSRTTNNWCGLFNTPKGCTNYPREGGCTDQAGKEWKHGCNTRENGKHCNKSDHNRANHVA